MKRIEAGNEATDRAAIEAAQSEEARQETHTGSKDFESAGDKAKGQAARNRLFESYGLDPESATDADLQKAIEGKIKEADTGKEQVSPEKQKIAAMEQRKSWLDNYTRDLDSIADSLRSVLKQHTKFFRGVDVPNARVDLESAIYKLRKLEQASAYLFTGPGLTR